MQGTINLTSKAKDVYNVESLTLPGVGSAISGLDASAHVFVGGVPSRLDGKPWTLWANRGFAGCIMVRLMTVSYDIETVQSECQLVSSPSPVPFEKFID